MHKTFAVDTFQAQASKPCTYNTETDDTIPLPDVFKRLTQYLRWLCTGIYSIVICCPETLMCRIDQARAARNALGSLSTVGTCLVTNDSTITVAEAFWPLIFAGALKQLLVVVVVVVVVVEVRWGVTAVQVCPSPSPSPELSPPKALCQCHCKRLLFFFFFFVNRSPLSIVLFLSPWAHLLADQCPHSGSAQ